MAPLTMLFASLLCLSLIGHSEQFFWGKTCPKDWNKLTTSFMRFKDVPMTENDALAEGWTQTDDIPCDGHASFVGTRYMYSNEAGRMILYDKNGVIAGIQAAFPDTVFIPSKFSDMFPAENGKRLLTAYFTNPRSICTAPQTQSGCVGEELYIQTGATSDKLFKVPLTESAVQKTKWTQGKCFYQMGNHYWYDLSKDMDANSFFPAFLLYNSGKLNAFGWAVGGDAQDPNFEHPTKSSLKYFFKPETLPKSLGEFSKRSTLHIYFQSSTTKYFC